MVAVSNHENHEPVNSCRCNNLLCEKLKEMMAALINSRLRAYDRDCAETFEDMLKEKRFSDGVWGARERNVMNRIRRMG